jgi:hypothetical protein
MAISVFPLESKFVAMGWLIEAQFFSLIAVYSDAVGLVNKLKNF